MALTILPDGITSDRTTHTARPAADTADSWEVSWLPGRRVNRDKAITAMLLADLVGPETPVEPRLWPHIEDWAADLTLTPFQALDKVAYGPRWADAPEYIELDDPEADG